jgi:phage shock protein A
MSVIENLFQLRRWRCKERRIYLAELDLLAQRLQTDASRLQAAIERAVVADDPALARPLIDRLGKLEGSIATVKHQIATANDALAAAEQELQRHELASARRPRYAGLAELRRARRSPRARPAPSTIASPDRGG